MKHQILVMLDLQDSINTKVSSKWREKSFQWHRAVWVECAEMLDHYGWKWWKHQNINTAQVKLELVDIWHFGLSILLVNSSDKAKLAEALQQQILITKVPQTEFRELLEEFVLDVLKTKNFNASLFFSLMLATELSFEELFKLYVGKNALNTFRQNNGYKEGEYKKVWQGKEDNEYLIDILLTISSEESNFYQKVYDQLNHLYP